MISENNSDIPIQQQINNLNNQISDIKNKIDDIDLKLDKITKILTEDVKENCDKMANHINFIERVYDKVKNPLGYVFNKIKWVSRNNQKTIEDL